MSETAIRARRTAYAGVLMRSRLEADYAAHLDRVGYKWEYEPMVFAGPAGQWLPDFRTTVPGHPDCAPTYVEVKPVSHLKAAPGEDYSARVARIDELLSRMSMTRLTEPRSVLVLDWWDYGRDRPVARLWNNGPSWTCYGDIPFALLWPGMGQAPHGEL